MVNPPSVTSDSLVGGQQDKKANLSLLVPIGLSALVFLLFAILLLREHYSIVSGMHNNYFVYLADSFLHGHLYISGTPHDLDLSYFKGHAYPYWPPLVAFMLMPAVAVFGVDFGDRWASALLAALSVIPAYIVIDKMAKRYSFNAGVLYKVLLTVFFALGTSNLILGYVGNHWFTSQIAASLMLMCSICVILGDGGRYRFISASSLWALSCLSRMNLVCLAPFFAQFVLDQQLVDGKPTPTPPRVWFRRLALLAIPLLALFLFCAWYNWARFGSVLDNGIKYHAMMPRFKPDFVKYGYMSLHYLPRNFYFEFLRLPIFRQWHLFKEPGTYAETTWMEGYSLFYQCPLLLLSLLTLRRLRTDKFVLTCWLTIVLAVVPILCIMGTGYYQFGARYLFDVVPLFYILTILATRGKVTPLFVILVILSLVINFNGLYLWSRIGR